MGGCVSIQKKGGRIEKSTQTERNSSEDDNLSISIGFAFPMFLSETSPPYRMSKRSVESDSIERISKHYPLTASMLRSMKTHI
jgi:hypothetical protein